MKKTYFLTNTTENKFPYDFVNSSNTRYIEVHPCYIGRIQKDVDKMDPYILMHSDFVWRDAYQDHALCICNEWRTKYKKYEYRQNSDTFKLWFTDISPIIDVKKEVVGLDCVDNTKEPHLRKYNLNEMKTYLQRKYPDKATEINDLYTKLNNDSKSTTNLLYLSSIVPDGTFKEYVTYHFVDHVTRLYGGRVDYENVEIKREGPKLGKGGKTLIYTTTKTYDDPNINRKMKETRTETYRLIDDDYKFLAEFLLMY